MGRPSVRDDGTIMVTWKTLPIVIVFVGVLVIVCAGTPSQQDLAKKVFLGVVALVWVFFLLKFVFRGGMFQRHPANEIAKLVAAGEAEEAYQQGAELIKSHPDDQVVRLNVACAMYRSGRVEEARTTFALIERDRLPRFLRSVYDDWRSEIER